MWWNKTKSPKNPTQPSMHAREQQLALDAMNRYVTPAPLARKDLNACIASLEHLAYHHHKEDTHEQFCAMVYAYMAQDHSNENIARAILEQQRLQAWITAMQQHQRKLEVHLQGIFQSWIEQLQAWTNGATMGPTIHEKIDEKTYAQALRVRCIVVYENNPYKSIQDALCHDDLEKNVHRLCALLYAYGNIPCMQQCWETYLTDHAVRYYLFTHQHVVRAISMHAPESIRAAPLARARREVMDFVQGKIIPQSSLQTILCVLDDLPATWHPHSARLGVTPDQWMVTRIRMCWMRPSIDVYTWYLEWLQQEHPYFVPATFPIQHRKNPHMITRTVHLEEHEYTAMRIRVFLYLLQHAPNAWYAQHRDTLWSMTQNRLDESPAPYFHEPIHEDDAYDISVKWTQRIGVNLYATAQTLYAMHPQWQEPPSKHTRTLPFIHAVYRSYVQESYEHEGMVDFSRIVTKIIHHADPRWKALLLWLECTPDPTIDQWRTMIYSILHAHDSTALELEEL